MKVEKHGLAIGIDRIDSEIFITLKAQGKLTHQDYETISPMIDAALASVKEPMVKVLVDATQLQGWELRAAWDDFKVGLKHGNSFDKIAIVGNKTWQELSAKVGSWFVAGDIKFYQDEQEALSWLAQ